MSLIKKSAGQVHAAYLSSNDKVMHFLQTSKHCPSMNSFTGLAKSSPQDAFPFEHRLRSCSENDSISTSSSSSSVVDESSPSILSTYSSLSDPIAHCSFTSSNISSEAEFDFNMVFDQISDDDDPDDLILSKNNADAIKLQGEKGFNEHFPHSSCATVLQDDYHWTNDDASTADCANQSKRPSFLYDSTNTLCSDGRFPSFTDENDGDDHDAEGNEPTAGLSVRSSSFSALQFDEKATLCETAPKKMVRFADVMGLDLESIRYMSPPEQTGSPVIPECVRLQFGQRRFAKALLNLPNIARRTPSSSSLLSAKKQYNLVSRNFTSRTTITPIIYENQVLLECLHTKDSTAYGTIRVHNCAYDKRVIIRLTDDEWATSKDIEAQHSMHYPHDNTDTFTFEITLPKSNNEIKRVLFAVYFQTMQQEFWDNNQGWNYVLDVLEKR